MSQTLVLRFKESPFSPWGASNRAVSRGTATDLLQNATQKLVKVSASVGCISSVNSLIGDKGLQRRGLLPPLITDSSESHLQQPKDPPVQQRPAEYVLEEMDHHKKTGVKKKTQSTTASATKTHDQQSAQQQQKPSVHSPLEKEEKSADTRLIELATYPGYDPHFPTPLPHGMVALEQMKRVTRAQKRLVTKREGFRETWRHLFYSPASQSIFQDYFWWFFLHRYQSQQFPHIQDLLFSRISINYVKVLCDEIDPQWKDPFFKVYPDAIAQCVYTAFIHAYPTSWNSFDENFKNELCQYISLWQVGTKPIPNSWEKWEFSLLEPSNLLKHVGKDEESPSKGGTKSGFNFDALLAKESKKATGKGTVQPSKASLESNSQQTDKKSLTSSSKSVTKEDKKRLSFADIERALSSVPQQPRIVVTRDVDPKTKGVSTPTTKLTTLERKKVEVAKEQLNSLQKIVNEKRKARAPKTTVNGTLSPQKKEPTKSTVSKTNSQVVTSSQQAAKSSVQSTQKLKDTINIAMQKSQRHRPDVPIKGFQHPLGSASTKSVASSATISSPPQLQKTQPAMKQKANPDQELAKKQEASSTRWKQRALELKQRRKEEQSTPLQGPVFDHAMFNVNGQSPLVKYYMKERDLAREKEYKTLVNRTEIAEKSPSQAVCYKDVLTESKEAGAKNQEQFQQHYKQQRQSMAESQRGRKKAAFQHKQNVKMVLANKKEVRDLSNVLTEYTLMKKKGDFNKTALTTAVNTVLTRVTKKPQ